LGNPKKVIFSTNPVSYRLKTRPQQCPTHTRWKINQQLSPAREKENSGNWEKEKGMEGSRREMGGEGNGENVMGGEDKLRKAGAGKEGLSGRKG